MKRNTILLFLVGGALAWYMYKKGQPTIEEMRVKLVTTGLPEDTVSLFTAEEVRDVNDFIDRFPPESGKKILPTDPLYGKIVAIGTKYNIFT